MLAEARFMDNFRTEDMQSYPDRSPELPAANNNFSTHAASPVSDETSHSAATSSPRESSLPDGGREDGPSASTSCEDTLNSSFDSTSQGKITPSGEPAPFPMNGDGGFASNSDAQAAHRVETGRKPFRDDTHQNTSRRAGPSKEPLPAGAPYPRGRVNGAFGQLKDGQVVVQRVPGLAEHADALHNGAPPKPKVAFLPRKYPLAYVDCKVPPVFYDESTLGLEEESTDELEKLRRDYLNERDSGVRPARREVRLLHKCRNVRLKGSFRAVPALDSMCNLIDGFDFDNTDLFPLGFEPSDSEEESSDDEVALEQFPSLSVDPRNVRDCRLELYLLKKRLKRESEKLQKNARLSVTVMNAAKPFPDSVGAALRTRELSRKRRNLTGLGSALQRCFYCEDKNPGRRCTNLVVPRSSMCVQHIGYSLDQKAFSFCTAPCCGKPVMKLNALIFGPFCEEHYLARQGLAEPPCSSGAAENGLAVRPAPPTHALPPHAPAFADPHRGPNSSSGSTSQSEARLPRRLSDSEGDSSVDYQLMNSITMDDFNVTDGKLCSFCSITQALVVDGDVTLSSVANELFHEEFNDIFPQLSDEMSAENAEPDAGEELEDSEGLLSAFTPLPEGRAKEELDSGHSWADISEFLRSEGYSTSPPHCPNAHEAELNRA